MSERVCGPRRVKVRRIGGEKLHFWGREAKKRPLWPKSDVMKGLIDKKRADESCRMGEQVMRKESVVNVVAWPNNDIALLSNQQRLCSLKNGPRKTSKTSPTNSPATMIELCLASLPWKPDQNKRQHTRARLALSA